MAFPPAHLLVGFGAAELVRTAVPLPRGRAWLLAGGLAVLPDMDLLLGLALGSATAYHGTFTHSLVAVAAVGLLFWALADRRWALLAAFAYASHLAVDLLDDRGRTNVLLGWPWTDQRPFAVARVFPTVPVEFGQGLGGALRSLLTAPALDALLRQTLVAAVVFVVAVVVAEGVRRVGK